MSDEWLDLEPEQKTAAPTAPVRFALRTRKKARARGVLLIRKVVVDQLGMRSHRVDVKLGQGSNTHQIAIVPNDGGRFELLEAGTAKGGGTFRVLLPAIDRWPDCDLETTEVKFEVKEVAKRKMLVISLPPICWDPASQRRYLQKLQPNGLQKVPA